MPDTDKCKNCEYGCPIPTGNGDAGNYKCPCICHKDARRGWEEELDEFYPKGLSCADGKCPDRDRNHIDGIKKFISDLLSQRSEKAVGELEKMLYSDISSSVTNQSHINILNGMIHVAIAKVKDIFNS